MSLQLNRARAIGSCCSWKDSWISNSQKLHRIVAFHAQPCPSSASLVALLCLCGLRVCHEAVNKVSLLHAASVPAEFLVCAALDALGKTQCYPFLLPPEPAALEQCHAVVRGRISGLLPAESSIPG